MSHLDILGRESGKEARIEESVREFSISQLVKVGMKEYTKNLTEFINGESRLIPKKVLEGMFSGDEATLALIVLRTVITVIMSADKGKYMLNSLSAIVAKSVLNAKTLEQLEGEHKALSHYIDNVYKRASDSKRLKAKMKSSLNLVGIIKEEEFLQQGSNANSLGSLLISILCESLDIIEIIKLDSKSRHEGVQYNLFKPFSFLVHFSEDTKYALLDLDDVAREFIRPTLTPLLVQPKKVTSWDMKDAQLAKDGRPRNIIKMPKKKQNLKEFKHILDTKTTKGYQEIHHMIEATAWTVNEDVHTVLSTVFNENILNSDLVNYKGEHFEFNPECLGGVPRRFSLEPDALIQKSKLGITKISNKGFELFDNDKEGLNRYNKIKNDLLAFNEANLNKALSLQSILHTASEYMHKTFWFTYQYDSRSRIYPVQGGLNPQSDSKGKALLKFAGEHGAKALTTEGHYWAKVHGANCWGLDKAELDERVSLIDGMISDGTLDKVGKYPLLYTELWSKVDDPYGFLAFAMEYVKVLADAKYPYAIPVALDATCSGIQIYSGMLRDEEGAKAVNVVGQVRNDIYGMVAEVANQKLRDRDYERYAIFTNANEEETVVDYRPIGDALAGKDNRNIAKRNTMTQPYSVTMKGMQDQLKETFTEMEKKGEAFWKGEIWQNSKLLADIHQRSIDEVVEGAKRGKEFIKFITGKCASRNKGLLWTTPIGFPVYQKNVKAKSCQINTHIWTPDKGAQRVQFRINKRVGKVNTHSQKNSCAPNFIHSLDSSLLHITVRRCHARGVRSFALIHDSYGVHPNDVPILNEEVREAFIEIFSEDVLYDWAIEVLTNAGFTYDEMIEVFGEVDDPMLNTLDLSKVRNATFMFS